MIFHRLGFFLASSPEPFKGYPSPDIVVSVVNFLTCDLIGSGNSHLMRPRN